MVVEMHRECGKPADVQVLAESVTEVLDQIAARRAAVGGTVPGEMLRLLFIELERTHATVTVDECPFEGTVDVSTRGPAPVLLSWTCPTCGHEHKEGPD